MSAFVPQRRRRTAAAVRVALTSAALASAVLAPATAAFAMDPAAPSPVPSAPATKPAQPTLPAPTKPADPTAPASTAPTAPTAPTTGAQPSAPAKGEPTTPSQGGRETGKADPKSSAGTQVGTEMLANGAVVRVYKLGSNHYIAKVSPSETNSTVVETIVADGKDGFGEYKGQIIRLRATDGEVIAWTDKAGNGRGGGGQGPVTKAGEEAARCRVVKEVVVGPDATAVLMNDQEGPKAGFKDHDGEQFGGWLDRKHPQQGSSFKIIDASTSHPKLWVKLQGGGMPASTYDFPALPAGCDTGTAGTATGAKANGGSTGTVSAAGAQTKVTPQGGVAAGAEGVGQGDDTALLAGGGALAAAGAAGLGFAVLYRRRAAVGANS
ncbi:hypothetical protein [Streptomyces sp. NPDC049585]|uniref:hypothetical protein n=1 Tax=Streptomyces sp. NPDC049585 TaxID=3155154 RepID=UPI003414BCF9